MTRVDSAASAAKKRSISRAHGRHKVIFESISQEKKTKKLRTVISFQAKAPPGYTFIPAGNPSLTQRCKDLSRSSDHRVFIVSTSHKSANNITKHVHRIGYHFATWVVHQACQDLHLTLTSSGRVVTQPHFVLEAPQQQLNGASATGEATVSQEQLNSEAEDALTDLFPKIPPRDKKMIIARAFKQGKNKVGTAANLPMSRRVQLAVVAHIRHVHTHYDRLLRMCTFHEARAQVQGACLLKLTEWQGDDEHDRADTGEMEKIIREVIVISDDEDDSDEDAADDEHVLDRDSSVEFVASNPVVHVLEMEPAHANSAQGSNNALPDEDQPYISDDEAEGGRQYATRYGPPGTPRKRPRVNRRGFHRYSAYERLEEDENGQDPRVAADNRSRVSSVTLAGSASDPLDGGRGNGTDLRPAPHQETSQASRPPVPERTRASIPAFPPLRTGPTPDSPATRTRMLLAESASERARDATITCQPRNPPRAGDLSGTDDVVVLPVRTASRSTGLPSRPVVQEAKPNQIPVIDLSTRQGPSLAFRERQAPARQVPASSECLEYGRAFAIKHPRPPSPRLSLVLPVNRERPLVTSHRSWTAGSKREFALVHQSVEEPTGESFSYLHSARPGESRREVSRPQVNALSHRAYEQPEWRAPTVRDDPCRAPAPLRSAMPPGPGCLSVVDDDDDNGLQPRPWLSNSHDRPPDGRSTSFIILENPSDPRRRDALPPGSRYPGSGSQGYSAEVENHHGGSSHRATATLPLRSILPVRQEMFDPGVRESRTEFLIPSSHRFVPASAPAPTSRAPRPGVVVPPPSYHAQASPDERHLARSPAPLTHREGSGPPRSGMPVFERRQLPSGSLYRPPGSVDADTSSPTWLPDASVFFRPSPLGRPPASREASMRRASYDVPPPQPMPARAWSEVAPPRVVLSGQAPVASPTKRPESAILTPDTPISNTIHHLPDHTAHFWPSRDARARESFYPGRFRSAAPVTSMSGPLESIEPFQRLDRPPEPVSTARRVIVLE